MLIEIVLKKSYERSEAFRIYTFEDFKERWLKFADDCFLIESGRNLKAINKPQKGKEQSSAKGGYQFLDASLKTAYKRLFRYTKVKFKRLPIIEQDWDTQTALFISNLCQQRGSDYFIIKMLANDVQGAKDLYAKFHHTNPKKKTRTRMDKIFGKSYLIQQC